MHVAIINFLTRPLSNPIAELAESPDAALPLKKENAMFPYFLRLV
jgi:hypothetical protein